MTTRFTSGDSFGVPSGYAGTNIPTDYFLPPCGIEDVDWALFNFFETQLKLAVNTNQNTVKNVPTIFSSGEKWAMLKKGNFRDKTGTLILPLVSIRRTSVGQSMDKDVGGRGINQSTGDLVIKRRLDPKDRNYQNLVNRLQIANQDNVSGIDTSQATNPTMVDLNNQSNVGENWLAPSFKNNIWEFLTIPSPQFFTSHYEITFWSQYLTQMNQMLEKFIVSYLPQEKTFRVETKAGYWFVARVETDEYSFEDNFTNETNTERSIKCKIQISIPGYIIGSAAPGVPAPVRRFVSAPMVSFAIGGSDEEEVPVELTEIGDYSDPTSGFSLDGSVVATNDQQSKQIVQKTVFKNPFTGVEQVQFLQVKNQNKRSGETTYKPYTLNDGLYKIENSK